MHYGLYATVPGNVQGAFRDIPILGTFMTLSTVQFDLVYAALIIYESLIVTCLHWWAWSAKEEWYDNLPLHDGYGSLTKDTQH